MTKKQSYYSSLKNNLSALGYIFVTERRNSIWLLFYLTVQGFVPAVILLSLRILSNAFAEQADAQQIFLALSLWATALAVDGLLSPWIARLQGNLTDKLTAQINISIMDHTKDLQSLKYFENTKFQDTLQNIKSQSSYQPINLIISLTSSIRSIVTILGVAIILYGIHPLIPLAVILSAVPQAVVGLRLQRSVWETMVSKGTEARKMQYYSSLATDETKAKEIKVYHALPYLIQKYKDAFENLYRSVSDMRTKQAIKSSLFIIPGIIANLIILYWLGNSLSQDESNIASVFIFAQSLVFIYNNLNSLAQDASVSSESFLFMNMLKGFLDTQDKLSLASSDTKAQSPSQTMIQVEDLHFAYEGSGEVLKGVSFTVDSGDKLAIVGENGSGKTTLIKLLLRLYEPSKGHIFYMGEDIAAWPPETWQAKIGIAFQDFGHYDLTLRENVGIADIPRMRENQDIEKALKLAGLEIKNREDLDEVIGKKFGTLEFSGGQWQKIAIARALFRSSADIFILDEPSASLDPRSEAALFEKLALVGQDKTVIFVTHRLSSVKISTRIIVMKDGAITQQGTHSELVAIPGEYRVLWELQAKNYLPPE